MEEKDDKYYLREILVRNKGFTPQLLKDLEHRIDLIIKGEHINLCQMNE